MGSALTNRVLATAFNKIRNHFGMSRLGQVAALAALNDYQHQKKVKQRVAVSLERNAAIAAANNCVALPSKTNFVAIDCMRDGIYAKKVLEALISFGLFVRMPGVAPQNRCIRVSAGTTEHLDLLEKRFPEALRIAKQEAGV